MKIHSVHFGINYQGTTSELAGCVPDMHLTVKALLPFLASRTMVLEKKADVEGMLREGRKVLHRLEPGDLAVFDLSSHGTREKVGNRYVEAVVGHDFNLIYDYEMDELFADRVPGSFVFAILDCCHSGTMHRGFPATPAMASDTGGGRRMHRSIPIGRCKTHKHPAKVTTAPLKDAWGFHGCEPHSYSYDGMFGGKPNGALHYYLIQALRRLKPGATYRQWFQLIGGKRPRGYLPSSDYPQQPVLVGSDKNLKRPVPFIG